MSKGTATVNDPRVKIIEDSSAEAYFFNGIEYRTAIFILKNACSDQFATGVTRPTYNLCGNCLELLLKSFFIHHGYDEKKLKHEIGHDLNEMTDQAAKLGLIITADLRKHVEILSPAIVTNYYRYGFNIKDKRIEWPVRMADLDILLKTIDNFIIQVGRAIGCPMAAWEHSLAQSSD